jgi:transcription antitermination factor NusG
LRGIVAVVVVPAEPIYAPVSSLSDCYAFSQPDPATLAPACSARWYAVQVRHQHEKAVARALAHGGFETFLPLYRCRRQWSDRVKVLELPLFASYVFARFPLEWRVHVLRTPGVRSIVSFNRQPAPVREEEIRYLRTVVESGAPIEPWPFLREGQRVRIERGPLSGVEGILLRFKGAWRVVVGVEILSRAVAAEVDRETVRPCAA